MFVRPNTSLSTSVWYKYIPLENIEISSCFTGQEDDEPKINTIRESDITASKNFSYKASFAESTMSSITTSPTPRQDPKLQQYKLTLNQKLREIESLLQQPLTKEWSHEIKKPNLNCYIKVDSNNHIWLRGDCVLNDEPHSAMKKLQDPKNQMKLDKNIEQMYIKENLDEGVDILYSKTKKSLFFESRDFLTVSSVVKEKDGSCMSVVTSITDDRMPPSKPTVRGEFIVGYTKLTPVMNKGKMQSKMVLLSRCAVNGDVSRLVAEFVAKAMASTFGNVKGLFESA